MDPNLNFSDLPSWNFLFLKWIVLLKKKLDHNNLANKGGLNFLKQKSTTSIACAVKAVDFYRPSIAEDALNILRLNYVRHFLNNILRHFFAIFVFQAPICTCTLSLKCFVWNRLMTSIKKSMFISALWSCHSRSDEHKSLNLTKKCIETVSKLSIQFSFGHHYSLFL